MSMSHREIVLTALGYREPDRVPLFYRDVPEVEQRLCQDLGLSDREALLQFFDVDFRWVAPEYIGPSLCESEPGRRRDIWGVEYRYVEFSERAGYWEAVTHPLAHAGSTAELDAYLWPRLDWFNFSTLAEQINAFNGYAIMTAPGYASPSILEPIQNLVGLEKALVDIVINPDFFRALVERILDFLKPFVERMLDEAGGRIDFFRMGDDFGTQRGLLIGPPQWRDFIQPALKQLADIGHAHDAHFYLHSCGAIRELISDLIDTGVDVLDPLQVKAAGMDPGELKREYGRRICFSGGVDEQELLPQGSPAEVKAGVRQLLDSMAPSGGFFIGPTHNLQDDIPTANIVAMYEAAREWRY